MRLARGGPRIGPRAYRSFFMKGRWTRWGKAGSLQGWSEEASHTPPGGGREAGARQTGRLPASIRVAARENADAQDASKNRHARRPSAALADGALGQENERRDSLPPRTRGAADPDRTVPAGRRPSGGDATTAMAQLGGDPKRIKPLRPGRSTWSTIGEGRTSSASRRGCCKELQRSRFGEKIGELRVPALGPAVVAAATPARWCPPSTGIVQPGSNAVPRAPSCSPRK